MLSDMQENMATQMPSPESNSVSAEPETSYENTRLTREEGRALIERNREFVRKFIQYMEENNLLPEPCPAPKIK